MSTTPTFDLKRLLDTVFTPKPGERIAVFIDLDDPRDVIDLRYKRNPRWESQCFAYDVFYQGLLALKGGGYFTSVGFYSYRLTGGSNLDLPDSVFDLTGKELNLESVLRGYDIVLYIGTYSATAPITAIAKRLGFRGATMHGVNQTILESGLSKDYREVSRKAEAYRRLVTRSDAAEICFRMQVQRFSLSIALGAQEAQKSHGLCPNGGEIANLPAGEVYFVPDDARGQLPIRYEDGTIALFTVNQMRLFEARLLSGNPATVAQHLAKIKDDPATGELGELGLGTQELPVSGADIQDEKIIGTIHLATGRSDHLGGHLTPDKFLKPINATHDDILFAPHKTPEIRVESVTFHQNGESVLIIQNDQPTEIVRQAMARA